MSGTTVDPRIALGTQVPQNNMLQNFLGTAQAISAMSQAQSNNELLQARRQVGAAMQNAIDPATGQLDTRAFMDAIRTNPMAGFLAPEALAQARVAQQGQIQVQQMQVQLGMQRLDSLSQVVGGLLERPDLTRADVVTAIGNVLSLPESERPFSAQTAAAFLGNLPDNPQAIRQRLMEVAGSIRENRQRLQDFMPQVQPVQAGGSIVNLDLNPRTNRGVVGQRTEVTSTPAELNAPAQFVGPSGEPRVAPQYQLFPMIGGMGTPAPGQRPQMPIAPGGNPAAVIGDGRYPRTIGGAAVNPPGDARSPTIVPEALGAGGVATGLPPGRATAMQAEGARSAERSDELSTRARAAPENIANLQQMRGLLRQITTGGPIPSLTRRLVTSMNAMLPENMRINPSGTAYQEEFVKIAERLAQQQRLAFAGAAQGSNMELESARAASPNEGLSNLGNDRIIAHLLGNEQAILVRDRAWQRWRDANGAESFPQFETAFNRDFDPRVFHAMFMTPQDRARMVRDMSEGDRSRFENAVRAAIRNGWISREEIGLGARQ